MTRSACASFSFLTAPVRLGKVVSQRLCRLDQGAGFLGSQEKSGREWSCGTAQARFGPERQFRVADASWPGVGWPQRPTTRPRLPVGAPIASQQLTLSDLMNRSEPGDPLLHPLQRTEKYGLFVVVDKEKTPSGREFRW